MRIVTAPDGSMTGPYESRTMWKGTRAELDERVARLQARARKIDFGQAVNQCLAALDVCTPDTVNVLVAGDGQGLLIAGLVDRKAAATAHRLLPTADSVPKVLNAPAPEPATSLLALAAGKLLRFAHWR